MDLEFAHDTHIVEIDVPGDSHLGEMNGFKDCTLCLQSEIFKTKDSL
jgi:hypothetical protein